jgi:hypothetical protein
VILGNELPVEAGILDFRVCGRLQAVVMVRRPGGITGILIVQWVEYFGNIGFSSTFIEIAPYYLRASPVPANDLAEDVEDMRLPICRRCLNQGVLAQAPIGLGRLHLGPEIKGGEPLPGRWFYDIACSEWDGGPVGTDRGAGAAVIWQRGPAAVRRSGKAPSGRGHVFRK